METTMNLTVLGELLTETGGECWHTVPNCPSAGLFHRYQTGKGILWVEGSGISRDVALLWWCAAGQSVADLWRIKKVGYSDETTRGWLNPETPEDHWRANTVISNHCQGEIAWGGTAEDVIEYVRPKGRWSGAQRSVHASLTTEETAQGYRVTVRYQRQRAETDGMPRGEETWTSEVGEEIIETYDVLKVGSKWADKWTNDLRRAAVAAVPTEEARERREKFLGDKVTYKRMMTRHAYRAALYFGLIEEGR